MSSRNFYETNNASTPIQKSSLPSIAISTIEETSSQKIRNKANKNYRSSLSSDPRDSKERLVSENTKKPTKRRRCISKTPDELKKNKKKLKRNERKRRVRRQLESSSSDADNWLTTREKTLSPQNNDNHQQKKSIEHAKTENIFHGESESCLYYPWERPRETVRDAPRFDDCYVQSVLENPLTRIQNPPADKADFICGNDEKLEDSDHDSVLLVNDHEKFYPKPIQNETRHLRRNSGQQTNSKQMNQKSNTKTQHVRNRALMMEFRNRDKELEQKIANGRGRRAKRRSSCAMTTTYGPKTSKKARIYDYPSSFEDSDDEIFPTHGMKCLKNPSKPKFFGPLLSQIDKIDMNERKEIIEGSHHQEISRIPKFVDTHELSRIDNCDLSSVDSGNKNHPIQKSPILQSRRPRERRSLKSVYSKSRSGKNTSSKYDEGILVEESNDSFEENFVTRPLKRRRANKFDLSTLESSTGYPVEQLPNPTKLNESLKENVATGKSMQNNDSHRFLTKNREKSRKTRSFKRTNGRVKKYRRITQLIYSDTDSLSEVEPKTSEKSLNDYSSSSCKKRKEEILSSSKETIYDDSDERTIVENNNDKRECSKVGSISIDKKLDPIFEEPRSNSYSSSSSLPNITSIQRFSYQLVTKVRSNRWKISEPNDSVL